MNLTFLIREELGSRSSGNISLISLLLLKCNNQSANREIYNRLPWKCPRCCRIAKQVSSSPPMFPRKEQGLQLHSMLLTMKEPWSSYVGPEILPSIFEPSRLSLGNARRFRSELRDKNGMAWQMARIKARLFILVRKLGYEMWHMVENVRQN